MFESLTCYISQINAGHGYESLVYDMIYGEVLADSVRVPCEEYAKAIDGLVRAVYDFMDNRPEYGLAHYYDILEKNGLEWSWSSMDGADVSSLDGQTVMALLMGAIRAERFNDGAMLDFCESGAVVRWLQRLQQLDETARI